MDASDIEEYMEPNELFQATSVGFVTMVGFGYKGIEPPYPSGNCFGVYAQPVTRDDVVSGNAVEYKIVNFHYENLKALLGLGLTWPIQCKLLGGRKAIIHDPRIGERWYSTTYCETCCPKELLPVTQLQKHEREIMRGDRTEHEHHTTFRIPFRPAEFP